MAAGLERDSKENTLQGRLSFTTEKNSAISIMSGNDVITDALEDRW